MINILIILLLALTASIALNLYQHGKLKRNRKETNSFIEKAARLEDRVEQLDRYGVG